MDTYLVHTHVEGKFNYLIRTHNILYIEYYDFVIQIRSLIKYKTMKIYVTCIIYHYQQCVLTMW